MHFYDIFMLVLPFIILLQVTFAPIPIALLDTGGESTGTIAEEGLRHQTNLPQTDEISDMRSGFRSSILAEAWRLVDTSHETAPLTMSSDPGDGYWSSRFGPPGVSSGGVEALETGSDGFLYAGGGFTQAGGVTVNRIARWDGVTWQSLDSGMNGHVWGLALGPDRSIYTGGSFTTAGGIAANNIARWDGSAWHPLETGLNNGVSTLAMGLDGILYVGGGFTQAGGVPANFVARWNGVTWQSLGSGMNNGVLALAYGPDNSLYAGGYFTSAGGVTANYIARWDGSAWHPLGSGTQGADPYVTTLAVGPDNSLYAGGTFTHGGGVPVNYIARWDGAAWHSLGSGMNGYVDALVFGRDGSLYAGGSFSNAGGVAANKIARWDGSTWHSLDTGLTGGVSDLALGVDGSIYAGGGFAAAGVTRVNGVARWDESSWHPLGGGLDAPVVALAQGPLGSMYAGVYSQSGGTINRVVRWDGTAWHALSSGMNDGVSALAAGQNETSLYAGGRFTIAGGVAANYVARWDGADWHPLGSGLGGGSYPYVYVLATGAYGSLYAGGGFTTAGGVTSNHIARWDGVTWHALGTGVNGEVYALAFGLDGSLYVGGIFTTAGGMTANNIARWDGAAWHRLGSGLNNAVEALAVGPDGSLYAGGRFTAAGGLAANYIARWDGTSWHALGSGLSYNVSALAFGSDELLYVGGYFTTAGGVTANRIARWDGAAWQPLGGGMNQLVKALAVAPDETLYVGGYFTTAGDQPSAFIAAWTGAVQPIEINQVLGRQYLSAQKYVAGKDTVVRVQLPTPVLVSSSSQRMEVQRNGNLVAILAPQPSTQPTEVLTFICPNRTVCGNWQEGVYTFRATIGSVSTQKSATLSLRRTLRILAVPVKVNDQGTIKRPDNSWKSGDAFFRHVYPVAANGVNWVLGSELDASHLDLTKNWDQRWLWARLKLRQPMNCLLGIPNSSCYDMIVGFVPAMRTYCTTQCETCGCALGWTYGSPATIVMTNGSFETPCPNRPTIEVNSMGSTVAHEFGHTFADPLGDEYDNPFGQYRCDTNPPPPNYEGTYWGGIPTCSSADRCTNSTEQPWPNATGTGSLVRSDAARPFEVNPTLPGSPVRGALPDMLSFMGSGSYQRDMWVTPRAYDHLFDQLAPTMMSEWVPTESVDAVLVSGWIGQDGSVGLDPWYRFSVPLLEPVTGGYSVEAIDSTGQMLTSQGFDVSFMVLNNPPQVVDPAPFEAVVASPAGTVAFRIKHGATTLAEVPISLNAPMIQVTAPAVGQVLSGPATIAWQSQDQDGDELYHTVEYSPNGQEWQVLTSAITQTQFIADFSQLSGSTSAQVRVTVSDGVNTATSTSGAFTVTRTPPQVSIYAPTSGSLAAWALMVTFSGGAYDYRDGWLRDPDVLTWSSDRDGTLGGGEILRVSTLSPGLHTITLSATNSANLTASTTMALTVGAPGDLNGDGCILVDDLTAIATAWMQEADPPLDLNGDGVVTVADIVIATAGWDGQCVPDDQASRANDG